jgi:hypothetical protein
MKAEAEGSFVFQATNFSVPKEATFYAHFCYTYNALVALGVPREIDLYIIGAVPAVDEENAPYVHHFVLSTLSETNENLTQPITMDIAKKTC